MRAVACLGAVVLAVCLAPGCASGPRPVVTPSGHGRVHFTTEGRAPIRFLLGGKQVIDGLDEGVMGMKVGERRRMVVPPSLSRRSSYPADLDPNAVLYYDVLVVAIEPGR